jgi:hypothetical protein
LSWRRNKRCNGTGQSCYHLYKDDKKVAVVEYDKTRGAWLWETLGPLSHSSADGGLFYSSSDRAQLACKTFVEEHLSEF